MISEDMFMAIKKTKELSDQRNKILEDLIKELRELNGYLGPIVKEIQAMNKVMD